MAVLGALGDLVLALSADTARFQSDLGRAEHVAAKFGREVGRTLGNLAGMLVALGGATGFGALVRGQIDAADEAGKFAQKVGIGVEQLTTYMVAANLADVSNEQLQTGFQQLSKNQADFVAGTGEAADAFRALGIEQEQVKALNGDTAALFELVTGKLSAFEDGANKTAIAMKIFGRSGAELIPLINGLEQTRREAAEFNAIIDKETAAAAERFNDNLTRVGIAVRAVGLSVARDLLPPLEQITEAMVGNAKGMQEFSIIGAAAKTVLQTIAVVGSDVAFVFRMIGGEIGVWAAQLAALARGDFKAFTEISKEWTADAAKARAELDAWQARIMGIGQAADSSGPKIEKKLAAPTLAAGDAAKKAAKEYERFKAAIMAVHEDAANAAAADQEISKRQADELRELAELRRKVWAGEIGDDGQMEGVVKVFEDLEGSLEVAEVNASRFGFTFNSALEDAIINGGNLSDVVKALEQDIARMIIRQTVTQPLANAVAAGIGAMFGGGSTSQLSAPTARAGGGPVEAGMPYIVGEQGREMFVPNSSGSIVPNGALGGVTVNIVQHIDSRTDQAAIHLATMRAKDMAVAEIQQIQQRRGDSRI